MPSDEEVTQRAGSLRAMTGVPEAACMGWLPPFEHACVPSRQAHPSAGQLRPRRRDRS
jgi:hypothetical protein